MFSKINLGKLYIKVWLYWVVFLLLYFAYKFIPFPPLKFICAVSESNFQHYKASFFSWIILSLLEYIFLRRGIQNRQAFIYSRLATATLLPWFVFILWYLGIALFGRMPTIPVEILYANIVTIIVGIVANIFEKGLYRLTYPGELKTIILLLFLTSLLLYTIFTFGELPWADVFIEPDWK